MKDRLSIFVRDCRKTGLKATHQRTEIYRELVATEEHPDAETVYGRVRKRIPSLSLDTVYRTLSMLEERGVICRVGSAGNRTRFDANRARHHHFVCRKCGMIGDFYSEVLDRVPVPREVAEMGSADEVYVELRGCCRKCQRQAKTAGTR